MAGSRKPGPLGCSGEPEDLDDGTTIRAQSPTPGPTGINVASTQHIDRPSLPMATGASRRKSATAELKVLRQGSRGTDVRKLQRQLNVRLSPSPKLAVDGIFGALTHRVVLRYQNGVSIAPDGV